MKIELSCAECGGKRFDYPARLPDDATIRCADCGHQVGTVNELQRRFVEILAKGSNGRITA